MGSRTANALILVLCAAYVGAAVSMATGAQPTVARFFQTEAVWGWLGAVGTIAAIFASALIALEVPRRERRVEAERIRAKALALAALLEDLLEEQAWSFGIIPVPDYVDVDDLNDRLTELSLPTLGAAMAGLPAEKLTPQGMDSFLRLTGIAAKAVEIYATHDLGQRVDKIQLMVGGLLESCRRLRVRLIQAERG